MAPRRVVADSDDDEDEDDAFSPVKFPHPTERPEPEPLSPFRQPSSPGSVDELAIAPVFDGRIGSSNRRSDKTDTSFFASIYDEQQKGVLQQSHLIENIVRQSHKASTSSGEVSLSGKGKGKNKNKAQNFSSGTDITSPIVLDRPVNHQSMLSDDATQLTTPRKSARRDMWDVPSSVESSKGKKRATTTYSKRKRSSSVLTTGSTGAAMFGSDEAGVQDPTEQVVTDVVADDGFCDDDFVKPSPIPATKKPRVSLYDATTAQNSTTFYIAQSNLTTMQKLEYQKVSVPANPHNGVPGSTANQASTCASTIAYSTPSLYASSGPPLPWERAAEPEVEPEQPETSQHVIDVSILRYGSVLVRSISNTNALDNILS
ncbi:hypothetical protein SLS62_001648 [Diatrype stigma]|uniref:Uncharacterized protein n=1 Tax=Diatrype stigma TaxID=117547 RepID=A0AAN9YVQ8_9PEZI